MKKFKAFSLIELLISLIIISVIAASFAPAVTKRIKRQNVVMNSSIKASCSEIDEKCLLCTGKKCKLCSTQVGVNEGYYVDPNINCDIKECAQGCQKCTFEGCLNCKEGYGYDKITKSCIKCGVGTYSTGGIDVCKNCAENFVAAEGASSCTECKALEHKTANMEKSACNNVTCSEGQYIENITCKTCSYGTYQEANNHQQTSCLSCPSGYYCSEGKKTACSSNCKSCTSSTKCTKCNDGYALSANKCVTDCFTPPGTNICITNKSLGSYNWTTAETKCRNKSNGWWRLPSKNELRYLRSVGFYGYAWGSAASTYNACCGPDGNATYGTSSAYYGYYGRGTSGVRTDITNNLNDTMLVYCVKD